MTHHISWLSLLRQRWPRGSARPSSMTFPQAYPRTYAIISISHLQMMGCCSHSQGWILLAPIARPQASKGEPAAAACSRADDRRKGVCAQQCPMVSRRHRLQGGECQELARSDVSEPRRPQGVPATDGRYPARLGDEHNAKAPAIASSTPRRSNGVHTKGTAAAAGGPVKVINVDAPCMCT